MHAFGSKRSVCVTYRPVQCGMETLVCAVHVGTMVHQKVSDLRVPIGHRHHQRGPRAREGGWEDGSEWNERREGGGRGWGLPAVDVDAVNMGGVCDVAQHNLHTVNVAIGS